MGSAFININQISPNPNNPRKNFDEAALEELAASIREHGIIQPLVVKYTDTDEGGSLQFQLICGERRLRAARMLRMEKVPVIYRVADEDELSPAAEALKMLVENLQREDLDPIEEAAAYQRVLDEFKYTQEDLSQQVGKSQGHIANRLRLLELPDTVRENISRGIISASHGKVLAGHKNLPAPVMEKAVEAIAKDNIPVAKADTLVLRLVAEKGLPLFDNYRKKPEFKHGKGSACYECENRAMGMDMYSRDKEQPFCLNHECWEVKQEEARQEALKDDAEQNLIDISRLSYNQYEYWYKGSGGYDQSECRDCEHLKKDKGSDRLYCLDPSCMKKKKTAKTKADNKQKNNTFQAELGQIAEMVGGRINQTFAVERDGEVTVKIDRATLVYIAAQVLANVDTWHDRKVTRYQYLKNKFGWDNDFLKSGAYTLLYHDWDTFHRLLETLDELQLLEVIMEWPAVARGLKGAEGWLLQQVPQPSEPVKNLPEESPYKLREGVDIEFIPKSVEEANREKGMEPASDSEEESGDKLPPGISSRVGWILKNSAGDINYSSNIPRLTGDELLYCIQKENRKSGLQKLKAEARRRGLQVPVSREEPGELTDKELLYRIQNEDGNTGLRELIGHVDEARKRGLQLPSVDEEQESNRLPASRYLDKNGRVIFVSTGLGSEFGTFWESPAGGKHRVKTQAMPMTPSREEAQKNLDAWAEKNGLQPVEDGDSECKSA